LIRRGDRFSDKVMRNQAVGVVPLDPGSRGPYAKRRNGKSSRI
jgi:hypothetical protein